MSRSCLWSDCGDFTGTRWTGIPSERDIGTVRPFVDYRKIEINGNEVRIGKGQEIVTGSFIKAYAVDRVVCRMRELGIDDGIINASGSTIYALGPAAGDEWDIAVSDPADNRSAYSFSLLNRCLSTSCQSETFVTVDGKRYGHILDPRTGYPSPNRLVCIASDPVYDGRYRFNRTVLRNTGQFYRSIGQNSP